MRKLTSRLAFGSFAVILLGQMDPWTKARADANRQALAESYGKLPMSFEANQGQTDGRVSFLSRGSGYSLFLTSTEAVLALFGSAEARAESSKSRGDVLRMKLLGSNPAPIAKGLEALPGKSNYFIGNDPSAWRTDVPTYGKVRFAGVYPGVDLVYYGNQRQLEYDFVVAPGAAFSAIRLGFAGTQGLEIDSNGELALQTRAGEIRWRKPVMYQEIAGVRHAVDGRYVRKGREAVGFEVGDYDARRPLIIDPVLTYSTGLGGTSPNEGGYAIAVDSSGNAYVTGITNSTNFPTTAEAFRTTYGGGFFDAFVTKLNATGSALVYSTYLGSGGNDQGYGIAVDSSGSAYVTGFTNAANFPTTAGAFQTAFGGGFQDAFVTKLSAAGDSLVYSTYLGGGGSGTGGNDWGLGIAVDSSGNAYVRGNTNSTSFPTRNAFQSAFGGGDSVRGDAFVTRLNAAGSALVYSTYLGGSQDEDLSSAYSAIAVDSSGNAYVTGSTFSTDLPTSSSAYQRASGGGIDAFAAKLDTNASGPASLIYSTYLGGSNRDEGNGIAVDSSGNAYITGGTDSTDFPTAGPFQSDSAGNRDAFVTKLNASGSALVYSTYLGGSDPDSGGGVAVNSSGNAYVTGYTGSADFPTLHSIQAFGGNADVFVTALNPGGSALVSSTYLGGGYDDQGVAIALDSNSNAYITGFASGDFPTTPGAFQTVGSLDVFVAKIAGMTPTSAAGGDIDPTFNAGGVGSDSDVVAVAIQPDGKIVIGGFFTSYNGDLAASDCVMRLNADGTRDTTFNPGGAGANTTVYALAVQPDGKILIGGQFTSYNGDAAASDYVMRLNADGTRDTTFNAGGAGANDYVFALAVQPDGKIVVGGNFFTYNGSPTSGRVMRLNADGTPDTTFNSGGAGANGATSAVAVQPDGKIVIAGLFTSYDGDSAASDHVMRLNADGTRDTSFNPAGTGASDWVDAAAVQSDGKIVIGGYFTSYNGDLAASDYVMRLDADGARDTSFNQGGAGANNAVYATSVQTDGKIVIGGLFTSYNGDVAASDYVMRLNTDGTRDMTFNAGGVGANDSVLAVALQPDEKIVIGGTFTSYNGDQAASDHVMRLLPSTPTPTPVCPGVPGGIISWWPGEGHAQDIVGHYDGAQQNGATFGAGMVGQAFSLDGIDDAIVVNNSAALNPASITVEAWIKPSSLPAGGLADVVTKWGFDATVDSYWLGLLDSGGGVRVHGGIGDGATGDSGFSGGTVTLNAWNHIAMTYDAASGLNLLYLNGVSVSQRVRANGIYPTTSRVFIGREDSNNNRFFSGLIDEPTIYSRALTDAEIVAIYNAGGNGKCGASATADTDTSVSLSPVTPVYGQSATFTAAVSPIGGPGSPTGSVQFHVDGAPISGPRDLIGGIAVLTTNILTVGTHAITAAYGGDSTFKPSTSPSLTQNVDKASTFTQLTSHIPSTTVVGQPYTVSVTVGANAPSAAIPFGTVTVTDETGPSCTALLSEGMGSCIIASTTAGLKGLVAAYGGGPSFNGSSSKTIPHRVSPASTTSTSTTVSSSPNPSVYGEPATFLANVTTKAPGAGTPTGAVSFREGARVLATANLNASGWASFTSAALSVGTHAITANFNGDPGFNKSSATTIHRVVPGSSTTGVIIPNNGGWAVLRTTKTAGQLGGSLFYGRGAFIFSASKFTSFVISGQMARMEGFSSNGQLFVATAYDGGPPPFDRFRLWIEGVEQTAGGPIVGGNVSVQPWGPDTRLKGWVDLHTHPMSNLAFGGKLFHGAPDVGSLMPAVEMLYDSQCRVDNRAISIDEALSQDGPTHGPWLPYNTCGDVGRWLVILALELANDAHISPPQAVGYPSFTDWPKWDDITHQKMWIDWIRRDWEGGLRVMVALSHNNRMLTEVVTVGGAGPISGVKNDKASSDLQIDEIKKLVAAHSDFMAIATTPAELESIIRGGRLAVVLGVEIDKIGDFSPGVTEQMVDDEIARLYGQGVRYIFPIHLTDNVFGDTAIYKPLFNIANFRENGSFWSVGCAQVADEVGFRSPKFPPVLDPFIPPGTPDPPRSPECLIAGPSGQMFVGHVNARSPNGLTSLGEFALKAMMKRGMIVDIDHMSDRAANRALTIANFPGGGYPLMSGHTGIRERHSGDLNAENARTKAQLAKVACLGGMFGVGTDGMGAYKWAGAYAEIYDVMRRAFAPGGACPQATPLGLSFIGLGTDMNSLVRTPPPTMIDTGGLPPRFTDIYNPNNPINEGLPPLSRSTTGSMTWDYNFHGVAHYGMYVDFLRDVRTWGGTATLTGKEMVDDQMMYGAENFYRMWLKAETQKARVP